MRRLLPAALAVLCLLAARSASAETLASRFPELSGALNARMAQIPASHLTGDEKKQKAALKKAIAALAADTDDPAATLRNAGKAVGALDKVYAGDVALDPFVAAIVNAMAVDVTKLGATLNFDIQSLPDGKAKTAAQKQGGRAEASLLAATTATPRTARLKLLAASVKAIAKGEKIVTKAGGGGGGVEVTTTLFDVDIGAEHFHLPAAAGPFNYTNTYTEGSAQFNLLAVGQGAAGRHGIFLVVNLPGLGDRSVSPSSSYSILPGTAGPLPATSGTVRFTAFDPVNRKVAGTFTVTFSDGATTVTLTNGAFTSTDLQTTP